LENYIFPRDTRFRVAREEMSILFYHFFESFLPPEVKRVVPRHAVGRRGDRRRLNALVPRLRDGFCRLTFAPLAIFFGIAFGEVDPPLECAKAERVVLNALGNKCAFRSRP
jgi:hypothetical protein